MSQVRFGQAGYTGFSRSERATAAEVEGRLPLTKAAKATGVSAARIEAFIEPCEWHHVGKYAQRVDFYDTDEIRQRFGTGGDLEHAKVARRPKCKGRSGVADFEWTEWHQPAANRKKRPETVTKTDVPFRETPAFYVLTIDGREVRKGRANTQISNVREGGQQA